MHFDLEKPDGAKSSPAAAASSQDSEERMSGHKRARDDPGPNKKKREKVRSAVSW